MEPFFEKVRISGQRVSGYPYGGMENGQGNRIRRASLIIPGWGWTECGESDSVMVA